MNDGWHGSSTWYRTPSSVRVSDSAVTDSEDDRGRAADPERAVAVGIRPDGQRCLRPVLDDHLAVAGEAAGSRGHGSRDRAAAAREGLRLDAALVGPDPQPARACGLHEADVRAERGEPLVIADTAVEALDVDRVRIGHEGDDVLSAGVHRVELAGPPSWPTVAAARSTGPV
jgi:hypothetical protein